MGLLLFFLPNFPGAMFIQGGTFIPDSRVHKYFLQKVSFLRTGSDHHLYFFAFLIRITVTGSSHFLSPNGQG
jgi:hypothetical protein